MFHLNKGVEITPALLQKMIERFRLNVEPQLNKYKNYYDGIQAILTKSYSDPTKPCNKSVINYCKNIVDSYCGYLATPGCISYRSDNDIEMVMDVLRYNDHETQDGNLLLDALVYGMAAELMFIDNANQNRFFCAGICSTCIYFSTSMMQLFCNISNQIFFVCRNDREFIRGLCCLKQ